MQTASTQMQHGPYVVYACSGCPWHVLIKHDGNEDHYEAAFRLEWEGDALFTLFPRQATGDATALLHIRLPAHAPAGGRPHGAAAISTHCHIPAVVQIEPTHHRILVELRCALHTLTEPPAVVVAPDPEIAFRFLDPEEAPSAAGSWAAAWETSSEGWEEQGRRSCSSCSTHGQGASAAGARELQDSSVDAAGRGC